MSRRLGQGVVTGLDSSAVATYMELPVMLMSSFFSDSAGRDDAFLDFIPPASNDQKVAPYISMKRSTFEEKTNDLVAAMLENCKGTA